MSEQRADVDAVADRVVAEVKSHVGALVRKAVAEAERGFLGQVEILRQRISGVERELAELRAKK